MFSRSIFTFLLCGGVLAGASAQSVPIAITNAHIETGDGRIFSQGTVVLQSGKIVAVGDNVAVPAGATIVDAKGLYVYPGFIDGYTSRGLKLPAAPAAGTPPDARTTAPATMWHANRRGIRPDVAASQCLDLESEMADYLAQGVTTAHLAPGAGLLRGATTVVDYVEKGKVLKPTFGQEFSFRNNTSGGYPGTLFAVVATVRQALADAKTYTLTPNAKPDPTWEPLRSTLAGQTPAIFATDTARDIARVLRVCDEFGLRPILAGGKEAYRTIPAIQARKAAVIVSLDLETEPTTKAEDKPNSPPQAVIDERHDLWAERRQNTSKLLNAGVPFMFGTLGATKTEFLANVRKLIAAGLPKEAALAALTKNAATLLGVADQVGTIAEGKFANLVLTTGDFADDKTEIRTVFVEGIRTDLKKEVAK